MIVPAFLDAALHVTLVLEPREWRFGWHGVPAGGLAAMLGPVNVGLTWKTGEPR